MKILLSPAKSLDYDTELPTEQNTQPKFGEEIIKVLKVMKKQKPADIAKMMSVSDNLAQLNHERYQSFEPEFTTDNSRPALYAFAGDVYVGLDAHSLDSKHLDKAQDSIRILSGLYGYLRPLDLIQPYRLEMGTKVKIGRADNLYEFWREKLTKSLNKEIADEETVVNLASNEYFKAIDRKKLNGSLVSPVFKDYKNGKLKVISFFAKKARGAMARFLVENDAETMDDLKQFAGMDYKYSEQETKNVSEPVFIR
jgi:cytoplasmic iron level regulating protein YaaA (DUF328/UPF0246 family)